MLRRLTFLLIAIALSACTAGTSPSSATRGAPATTAPGRGGALPAAPGVILYYLRNGVVAAGQRVQTTGDARVEAVQALTKDLSDVDKAAGLQNAMPTNVIVNKFTVENGTATIDLSRTFETRDTQQQVAQVVYTLTQFPEIKKVKFLIDTQDNGATGVPPIGRDDLPARFSPDVLLDSPSPGLSTSAVIKVSGDVNAQFSSFPYRVEDAFGQELTTGTIAVKFGTGRKRFDQTIEAPGPFSGGATFVVDPPAGSSQPGYRVPFTLTP
ncbi:MAG: GerMN domain-containing protein [Actinobacteria bacterium]|nr:GerMN domain-containing protein [Actinomycetota bacterium]